MAEMDRQFTLLLVDDNPTNLLLLTKIIELDLPEVRVLTAKNAMDGLALAEREQIDGAFIDVQMPRMNGLDMCRRLNENPRTRGLPLVLMTAHVATPETRAEGLGVGAYDFISQPISNVEMLARIKVMLRMCASDRSAAPANGNGAVADPRRLRWLSGLLISGEGSSHEPDQQLLGRLAVLIPDPAQLQETQLFDLLTEEFPSPWRRTLLKAGLLEAASLALLCDVSEIDNLAAVFDYLGRHGLSLLRQNGKSAVLHLAPETRELLRRRAEHEFSEQERLQLYLKAADWFRLHEEIPAALKCLISAGQYEVVSQLISSYGLGLIDRGGLAPLMQLPEDAAASCGWLSLVRGIALFEERSQDAIDWLELASQLFQATGQPRGQLLALAQQALLSIYLDGYFERWAGKVDLFYQLAESEQATLEVEERLIVSYALGLVELFLTGRLDQVERLVDTALAESQQHKLLPRQLELYLLRTLLAVQQGRLLVARTLLEQAFRVAWEVPEKPEHRILPLLACDVMHAAGDLRGFREQLQMVRQAAAGSGELGMISPLLNFFEATTCLSRGDYQRALELLEIACLDGPAAKNAHVRSRLLQVRGCCLALAGREAESLTDMQTALEDRAAADGVLFRLENLLYAGVNCYLLKLRDQARDHFTAGLSASETAGEERYRVGFHAWLAVLYDQGGDKKTSVEYLEAFLERVSRWQETFFWGLVPELLHELVRLVAGTRGEEALRPLLKTCLNATLDEKAQLVPLLKVCSLGHFRLELEGRSFSFSSVGHAPRQIFALLMIAPNRRLSYEVLMDQLWPDSAPSKARNSLDTAVSRLRKALEEGLGSEVRKYNYLSTEKRILMLRYIDLDMVEVEGMMKQARYALQRGLDWQAEHALRKIETFWDGEFLAGYDLEEAAGEKRESLNELRLEQLELLAGLLGKSGRNDEAIKVLQRGLALDPIRDSLVRSLLLIHNGRGEQRAMKTLLENYRTALERAEFPGEEITELLDALVMEVSPGTK
ncbi:MAG: hypothetical protein C0622_08130 [Desulfuromonas sp.]|nr:MAG: hypothetical protein C0622_08130 [Desulfuromonas sp.]